MSKKIYIILFIVLGTFWASKYFKKSTSGANESEKVLHVETNRKITTLDPAMAEDKTSITEISKVYEGLYEYHYLKRPAEIIPNLAESLPEISEDGMRYTIKIKQGVHFHDDICFTDGKGRELKASDFIYTIMRFADPKTNAPLYPIIEGLISGLSEWRQEAINSGTTDYSQKIAGLELIDDYTFAIVLTKPNPLFIYNLAMWIFFAIPKEAVDYYGEEFCNHPVGTGPFIIPSFNAQDDKVIAYKNKNFREKYYPTDASEECKSLLNGYAGKKLPFVDKIVTHIILEEQTKWLKFKNKELDILDLYGCSDLQLKISNYEPVKELRDKGIRLLARPFSHTSMYAINFTSPILNNKYLRQAISYAYDKKRENELFYGGIYTDAYGIIPPTMDGYEAKIQSACYFNLNKAKEMMALAGYPHGVGLKPIKLDIKQGVVELQQAEFFKKCMAEIGIVIEINVNSFPELVRKMQTKELDIFKTQWFADYPNAENFLALFYKGDVRPGIYTNFSNSEYDKLYEEALASKDNIARSSIYKKMNDIIASEIPIIPQTHATALILYYDNIKNLEFIDSKLNVFEYIDKI